LGYGRYALQISSLHFFYRAYGKLGKRQRYRKKPSGELLFSVHKTGAYCKTIYGKIRIPAKPWDTSEKKFTAALKFVRMRLLENVTITRIWRYV